MEIIFLFLFFIKIMENKEEDKEITELKPFNFETDFSDKFDITPYIHVFPKVEKPLLERQTNQPVLIRHTNKSQTTSNSKHSRTFNDYVPFIIILILLIINLLIYENSIRICINTFWG